MPDALELNVTTTTDATTIADSIFGDGIQVVASSLTGAATQAGTYTGGETTSGGVVPSDSGVILSTGNATDFTSGGTGTDTNTSASTSTGHNGAGDTDLDGISSTTTYDAVVFEATFIPDDDYITMQFVFSSEEYLEYVNSGVNDTLGVWVNGDFVPLTSSGDTVSIDTVNDTSNSNLYVDNPAGTDPFNTEMDGFTLTLSFKAQVNPGVNNTIKIGLADGGDSAYDTNVLIAADSIQTVALAFEDSVTLEANSVSVIDVLANDRDSDGDGLTVTEINGQAVAPGDSVTLNTGEVVTLNDDYTLTVAADGDLGETVFTYTVESASGNTDVGYVNIQTVANAPLDGIVEGSGLGDLIDVTYTGDAEGDMVDANDAIGVNGTTGDDDYILGYGGDDTIASGAGDDIVDGGTGDDQISTGSGDDTIILSDGFGNDTITGGETGETDGDVLDMSAVTSGVSLDLTDADPEAGSVFEVGSGGGATRFSEIENITLSAGRDTVHLADGSGSDSVSGFNITDSGDGTAVDQLNVGKLTSDGGTTPVTTTDVTVSSDPYGNAVLTFPGGESITLQGVNPLDLSTVDDLVAIGIPDGRDYVVEGTSGGDVIDAGYTGDPEGDLVDANDAADGSNDDVIQAGGGDDSVVAGAGNDFVQAGTGNDTVEGGIGDDTIYGGTGGDSLVGGDGTDTIYGEDGNDTIVGGAAYDEIIGGAGDDLIYAGTGEDAVEAGGGDDTVMVEDNFGNDKLIGGETAETDGDTLDLSLVTDDLTVDLSNANPETGTFSDGVSTAQFVEFEHIILGGGRDTIVLADGSGTDSVQAFDLTDSGDGSTNDQLDVSGLTSDGGTTPVTTTDVTVTDDGNGNAVLTFPGGESITLQGVNPLDLSTVDDLVAIGIPDGRDYVVEGTSGGDVIDAGYAGDPEGDLVDANDNATGTNDDVIVAGAGADTISGGLGADTMDGGTGTDAFILDTNFGDDVIVGGESAGDADVITANGVTDDLTITFTGEEAGTITGAGDTVTFSEIEVIESGSGNDSIDASATTDGVYLATGDGADTVQGGAGDDTIKLGDGNPDGDADVVVLEDGFGDDVIGYFDTPTDNGDGTWTGIDTFDVTGMTDGGATRSIPMTWW